MSGFTTTRHDLKQLDSTDWILSLIYGEYLYAC